MSEVKINHVYKRYGSITVVDDFNLEVKDGEFISILGPSGCGKTTTLRMVAGFERATEGTISIGDTVVSSSEQGIFVPPEKRGIGMVFQSYAVWPHMTVADNVGYPLKIQHVPTEERKSAWPRCSNSCTSENIASASRVSSQAVSSNAWLWHEPS